MTIDTRFDIGDKVWVAVKTQDERWVVCVTSGSDYVVRIVIDVAAVMYHTYFGFICHGRDLFLTKKEAKAECAKRNEVGND